MLTDERCPHCPRREAGLPSCIGQGCPAYCGLAARDELEWVARILAWTPPRPEIEHSDGTFVPTETNTATEAAPLRPSVAVSLSVLNRMKACPHRAETSSCGCGGMATCARDGREVNHADCFACLQSPTGADPPGSSDSGS